MSNESDKIKEYCERVGGDSIEDGDKVVCHIPEDDTVVGATENITYVKERNLYTRMDNDNVEIETDENELHIEGEGGNTIKLNKSKD